MINKNSKIIVSGASGLLGRAIVYKFKENGHNTVGLGFSRATKDSGLIKLDLTDLLATKEFLESVKPNVFVHCAAEKSPDKVEADLSAAEKVNVEATKNLASLCQKYNIKLIFISTDYVFDGSSSPVNENSPTNPLNAYGMSKLKAEKCLINTNAIILRIPILYGPSNDLSESAVSTLIINLYKSVNDNVAVKVDDSVKRYPTLTTDVARVIYDLFLKDCSGIFHYTATLAYTKAEMCDVFQRILNISPSIIRTKNSTSLVKRPGHLLMSMSKLQEIGVSTASTNFEDWWKIFYK